MPDSFYRASILGSFRMDPRLLLAGMTETRGHARRVLSGIQPSCHARQLLSGIHLAFVSNGSPLTDGGDDEREEWMSATNLRIGAIRVLSVTIMNGKMFHLRSILQTRD
jgi:hypothetical protein